MSRHTVFISDIHLSSSVPKITKLFLKFLEEIAVEADALYILGDLFQIWIGDDDYSVFNDQLKSAFKKASSKIPVYLMPGNRDFLLGKIFAKESGCTLVHDSYVIDLYGRKTILTHGDILCTKDIKYCIFRNVIRFPYGVKLFLKLPLIIRSWLAKNIQKYSAKAKASKNKKILIAQKETAQELLNRFNSDQIIHGHTHIVEVERLSTSNEKNRRISLGEWDKQGSVLFYYDNHNFEFNNLT